jgi:hypothetical protein
MNETDLVDIKRIKIKKLGWKINAIFDSIKSNVHIRIKLVCIFEELKSLNPQKQQLFLHPHKLRTQILAS